MALGSGLGVCFTVRVRDMVRVVFVLIFFFQRQKLVALLFHKTLVFLFLLLQVYFFVARDDSVIVIEGIEILSLVFAPEIVVCFV